MKIIYKDVFDGIEEIEDSSVRCCITSPPYYQCRNYGNDKQLGLESTVDEYIENLCRVFDALKDKLTEDGNLFVNIGDKYKNKDLLLIPTDFAQAMRKRGWILRNDIIWHKPNFQPSPVRDRLTNTYEHIFHFVNIRKGYYYDLDSVRIPTKLTDEDTDKPYKRFQKRISESDLTIGEQQDALQELDRLYDEGRINKDARIKMRGKSKVLFGGDAKLSGRARELEDKGFYFHCNNPKGKNPGDTLSVNIKSHKGSHEAVFPKELIEPLIKMVSAKGDTVLDCFAGSGTTCKLSDDMGRFGLGIELNDSYRHD